MREIGIKSVWRYYQYFMAYISRQRWQVLSRMREKGTWYMVAGMLGMQINFTAIMKCYKDFY